MIHPQKCHRQNALQTDATSGTTRLWKSEIQSISVTHKASPITATETKTRLTMATNADNPTGTMAYEDVDWDQTVQILGMIDLKDCKSTGLRDPLHGRVAFMVNTDRIGRRGVYVERANA